MQEVTKPIYVKKETETLKLEIIMQYVNTYTEDILSFVNKIKTSQGGTHVTGFRGALTRTITTYNQKNARKQKHTA